MVNQSLKYNKYNIIIDYLMDNNIIVTDTTDTKIVIGKTWFYVALILIAVILIFMYRCHHEQPKNFKEPDAL